MADELGSSPIHPRTQSDFRPRVRRTDHSDDRHRMDSAGQAGGLSEGFWARYSSHLDLLVCDGADRRIYRPIDRDQAEFADGNSSTAFGGAGAVLFGDRGLRPLLDPSIDASQICLAHS